MIIMAWHCGEQMVLNLEVQVPSEPVIEKGLFNITGGQDLSAEPVSVLLCAHSHWYVAHLGNICNPRTFKKLDQIDEQHSPKDSIVWAKCDEISDVKAANPGDVHPISSKVHHLHRLQVEIYWHKQWEPNHVEVQVLLFIVDVFDFLLAVLDRL